MRIILPCPVPQLIDAPGWSNGRDVVDTWSKRIFRAYSSRQQQGAPEVGFCDADLEEGCPGHGARLSTRALLTAVHCCTRARSS